MTAHACDRRRWLALALALLLGPSGASRTLAEPALAQRREAVGGMEGVSVRLPAGLWLHQGSPEELSIEAEPKVLDQIVVTRSNGIVIIDSKSPGFQTRHPIRLRLTLRTVRTLHADSAAALHSGPLKTDRLRITLEGSDELTITRLDASRLSVLLSGSASAAIEAGQVDNQDVELQGAGDYDASSLHSRQARITAAGSGDARVHVSGHVEALIEGSGDIEIGGPAQVSPRIDGAGEIVRHR